MKMNKKGVIEEIQAIIVPLVAIAIILVVGFLIMAEGKDQIVKLTGVSTAYANETVSGWVNDTYVNLDHGQCMTFSCSEVLNSSDGAGTDAALSADCYDCTVNLGFKFINHTATSCAATYDVNVSYSCSNMTSAFNATSRTQDAMQDIPGWLPIIVITIIGALLIGLVSAFRRQRQ